MHMHGSRRKFVEPPFTDPDVAARKLVEIASTIEPVQNGRIYIELVNAPFLKPSGSGDEFTSLGLTITDGTAPVTPAARRARSVSVAGEGVSKGRGFVLQKPLSL